ncbi:MAG: exodeoxyribonuclease VII small subunit [Bacteroidales bacterium]|jgi:exodeoxyribonuclease VII small subunit|nr:exodeoxyribonuclease VII small subunit [Bacteroidales bacterium]
MAKKEFTYNQALKELEDILAEIENEDLDLDLLSTKVKRATFLIKECKSRLKKTSAEIDEILGDWENIEN